MSVLHPTLPPDVSTHGSTVLQVLGWALCLLSIAVLLVVLHLVRRDRSGDVSELDVDVNVVRDEAGADEAYADELHTLAVRIADEAAEQAEAARDLAEMPTQPIRPPEPPDPLGVPTQPVGGDEPAPLFDSAGEYPALNIDGLRSFTHGWNKAEMRERLKEGNDGEDQDR